MLGAECMSVIQRIFVCKCMNIYVCVIVGSCVCVFVFMSMFLLMCISICLSVDYLVNLSGNSQRRNSDVLAQIFILCFCLNFVEISLNTLNVRGYLKLDIKNNRFATVFFLLLV